MLPALPNPLLVADFLTRSLQRGGMAGMLALNGIFVLVTQHGLEYPEFYTCLYNLLEVRLPAWSAYSAACCALPCLLSSCSGQAGFPWQDPATIPMPAAALACGTIVECIENEDQQHLLAQYAGRETYDKSTQAGRSACGFTSAARPLGHLVNWPHGLSWLVLHMYLEYLILLFLMCAADQAAPLSPAAFSQQREREETERHASASQCVLGTIQCPAGPCPA